MYLKYDRLAMNNRMNLLTNTSAPNKVVSNANNVLERYHFRLRLQMANVVSPNTDQR